jgi:hypothetical protein
MNVWNHVIRHSAKPVIPPLAIACSPFVTVTVSYGQLPRAGICLVVDQVAVGPLIAPALPPSSQEDPYAGEPPGQSHDQGQR